MLTKKRILALALTIFMFAAILTPAASAEFSLKQTELTISVGETGKISIESDQYITGPAEFFSDNAEVAIVDVATGEVTGIASGTANISVVYIRTLITVTIPVTVLADGEVKPTDAPEPDDEKTPGGVPSDWAQEEVALALELGLVPETIKANYQDAISRADFCDLIITLIEKKLDKAIDEIVAGYEGAIADISFTDTENANVLAAASLGIASGRATEGIFDPDASITRQEAAKMLALAAKVLGFDISIANDDISEVAEEAEVEATEEAEEQIAALEFADAADIAEWAKDYISFIYINGIMNGTSTDPLNFSPNATYSVEQSILTALRLFNLGAEETEVSEDEEIAEDAEEDLIVEPIEEIIENTEE